MKEIDFVEDGDEFFEQLWQLIDSSKTCCWILTYHMVDNFIANETLRRLIRAAERGVSVVLYIDHLNYWVNPELASELQFKGGVIHYLNPINLFHRYMQGLDVITREGFERYHQKLFIIDNTVIVGSANLDCAYAGVKHGNSKFYDINLILKKRCVKDAQKVFKHISERYNWHIKIPLIDEIQDDSIELLVSEPNYLRWDIQERILQMLNRAQKKIVLLHGYYYDIKKITVALQAAIDRGVQIEFYTSKTRDQPVYKRLRNSKLTKNLQDIGVKVYEYPHQILHMKGYIIDDNEFTIGSFNNDRWSWSMNNELNIYINNPQITHNLLQKLEVVKSKSLPVEPEDFTFSRFLNYKFWDAFLKVSERVMNRRKFFKLYFPQAYIQLGQNEEEIYQRKIKSYKENMKKVFQDMIADTYI